LNLEEMRNGLISDKRALVHTDLKLAIKEQKTRNHVLFDRNKQVASEVKSLEADIAVLREHKLTKAREVAAWCETNMQVLDAYDAEMLIAYTYPSGESGEKPLKAIEKDLREMIAEWRRREIPRAQDMIKLGTLTLNRLPMDLVKRYATLATKDTLLVAEVRNPVTNATLTHSKFLTPDALCKVVRTRYEELVNEPASLEIGIREREASMQRLLDEQQRLEQPDYAKVKELEAKMTALEKDMRDNPYQRRGRRREEPAQVEIEVGGVKVRQGLKKGVKAGQGEGRGAKRMVDEGVKDEEEISVQIGRARV